MNCKVTIDTNKHYANLDRLEREHSAIESNYEMLKEQLESFEIKDLDELVTQWLENSENIAALFIKQARGEDVTDLLNLDLFLYSEPMLWEWAENITAANDC